jgi:hypothetical protein
MFSAILQNPFLLWLSTIFILLPAILRLNIELLISFYIEKIHQQSSKDFVGLG